MVMAALANEDLLSCGDALFLYLEREGMPLHIASISIFEGNISLPSFSRFIASKLPLVPRYRQRVNTPPLNIGLPAWACDPNFDLRNHVREIVLRRGTNAEFQAASARILSATMDRTRPLWDLTLVRGLQGHRTGLVTRVHHCLADGLAGIGLMNALLDPSPAVPNLRKLLRVDTPPSRGGQPVTLLESSLDSASNFVQQALTTYSDLLVMAQRLVTPGGNHHGQMHTTIQTPTTETPSSLLEEWSSLLPELVAPAQRLPFNVVCRGPQKFHWAEIPLADIKAIKNACGATVNDVALAAIIATVRRYVELHGVRTRGRRLRVVVPVSVRGADDAKQLGNRITFLPLNFPLDIRDPRRLVEAVRARTAQLKTAHLGELIGFLGSLIGIMPSPLQALFGPIASQLPLSVCNLIFTNVRGPDAPLYLLGHQMLACYPYVPIGGEMGMNCAMLTYNGVAYFGFTGDVNAAPDLQRFERFLAAAFADLRKLTSPARSRNRQGRKRAIPIAPAVTPPPEEPTPPKPLAKAAVA